MLCRTLWGRYSEGDYCGEILDFAAPGLLHITSLAHTTYYDDYEKYLSLHGQKRLPDINLSESRIF